MGKTGTKQASTIATVAIAVLLVVSAVGMGIRQLHREGVFSETKPVVKKQVVEAKVPTVIESSPEPSAEEADFQAWVAEEMDATTVEQEAWEDAAEPEPVEQEAPKTARAMTSKADWQKPQMVKGGYGGKSPEEWAAIKAAYGKGDGAARFEKISVSEFEDVYVSPDGDQWRVTRLPDGTSTKVQVHPDGSTGEVYRSDGGDSGK